MAGRGGPPGKPEAGRPKRDRGRGRRGPVEVVDLDPALPRTGPDPAVPKERAVVDLDAEPAGRAGPPPAAGAGRPRTHGQAAARRTVVLGLAARAGEKSHRPGPEAAAKRPRALDGGSRPAKRAMNLDEEGEAQITGMRTFEEANAARWASAEIIDLSSLPDRLPTAARGDPDCVVISKQRRKQRGGRGRGSVSAQDVLDDVIAAVTEDLQKREKAKENILRHKPELLNHQNANALVLLNEAFATLKQDGRIRDAHTRLDTSQGMREVDGHKGLAKLAELWSSFSCGFRYDKARTQLWVKPFLLGQWLNLLHHRDYEVRVVGHGVRSGRYDQLAKDPSGFNVAKSQHGAHGYGVYVSPFDAIPADYGRRSTQLPGAPVYPDGTFVLALLLTEPEAGTLGRPAHEGGGMKWFHLGSKRRGYIGSKPGGGRPTAPAYRGRGSSGARPSLPAAMRALAARACKQGAPPLDAIVVRDSNVLLPLGRVVARE